MRGRRRDGECFDGAGSEPECGAAEGDAVLDEQSGARAIRYAGVELVATPPAKLFGLYPRKGTVAVGSDADLVIFDPQRKHTISAKTHHMRVDYSMFEGIEVTGMPQTVISRGRILVDGDRFLGRPGAGEFLRRSTYAQP